MIPTGEMTGWRTIIRFAVAVFAAVLACAPALATEVPTQLTRAADAPIINGDTAIDPWGGAANRPAILDIENPVAVKQLAPAPILPVQDRLVGKLVHWVMLRDKEQKQSFGELTEFINANPGWPKFGSLILKAERAIDATTSNRGILDWFENHSPRSLNGSIAWSRALFHAGNEREAIDVVRRGWTRLDMTEAQENDYLGEFGKYLEPMDHAARLDRLLWDNRRTAAKRHGKRTGEDRRALAAARLLLMARKKSGIDAAIGRVPSWLESDPGLQYERVRWRRRMDMDADAVQLLLSYKGEMSHPGRWWSEREILARRFLRDGDPATAYRLVSSHGLTDRAKRAEAEFLAGWISLRFLNDPHAAFGHFSTLYDFVGYPISRARGSYWAGRAAEAAGEIKISEQWYRTAAGHGTTFYGQLAADRLGMTLPPPAGQETRIDPIEAEAFERDDLVRLARLLIGLKATRSPIAANGSMDPAKSPKAFLASLDDDTVLIPLLRHIAWRGKTATEWVKAAKLARDAGRTEIAVYIARRAAKSGVVLRDLGYPTMVVEGDLPLNMALLHALIRQESAFDPGAHSSAGARGLMQLMPATAKGIARDLKIKGHSTDRLTDDPLHNLTLGSAYLESMLKKYNGSMVMALAAYNAGPHRVNKWRKKNGDPRGSLDESIDWIESIPFSETRNYVQRILETLPIYRWKLNDNRIVLLHPEDLTRGLPGYGQPASAK